MHGKRKFEWKKKGENHNMGFVPADKPLSPPRSEGLSNTPEPISQKRVHFSIPSEDDRFHTNLDEEKHISPSSAVKNSSAPCHSDARFVNHAIDHAFANSDSGTMVVSSTDAAAIVPYVDATLGPASSNHSLPSTNRTDQLLTKVTLAKNTALQSIPSLKSCLKKPGCRLFDPT